jgi:antirestriction protein
VGDHEIELNGYSVDEIKELVAVVEEQRAAAAERWAEISAKCAEGIEGKHPD